MKESQLSRLVRHIWAEVKLAAWGSSRRPVANQPMTIRAEFSVGLNHLFEIMDLARRGYPPLFAENP
jgi:hypothetical protein